MYRKRPVLKPGDVCRVNKKCRRPWNARISYVVIRILSGNGSDRYSDIQVAASTPSRFGRDGFNRPVKINVCRNMLWYTGYNIYDGLFSKDKPKPKKNGTYNGRLPEFMKIKVERKSDKGPHKCHCSEESFRRNGCTCNGL